MEMTVQDFYVELVGERARHPEWRGGQLIFNHLSIHRPDLAERIRGTDLDPFYDDSKISSCLAWLEENWD